MMDSMGNEDSPIWSDELVVSFSTKADGNMYRTNETRQEVYRARRSFIARMGLNPTRTMYVRTSHSCNLETVQRSASGLTRNVLLGQPNIDTDFDYYYDGSDGILTADRSISIALVAGDCIPVVVWDETSGIHGVIHVGMLGALNNIVGLLPAVLRAGGVDVDTIRVHLGPSIAARDYNIATSGLWTAIKDQALANVPEVVRYITQNDAGSFFDNRQMVLDQLARIGVKADNLTHYSGSTAAEDSSYFSHHKTRFEDTGLERFLTVVGYREA